MLRSFCFIVLLALLGTAAHGQYIYTIAGTPDNAGYTGDGGPATLATLYSPSDIAVDKVGNLYITDFVNNVIRKLDTMGNISTIAGDGVGAGGIAGAGGGFSGDGGPATAAELDGPFAIALDKNGNIFFADGYNHRVRKIDTTGKITTIAGGSIAGYTGDGGPATAARLDNPVGLAFDKSGNLYIADDHNNAVRKIDTTGKITTFAGNNTAGYSGDGHAASTAALNDPIGVGTDSKGNVYIADAGNNVIRKVDTGGIIITFAGNGTAGYSGDNGPALAAMLSSPERVTPDDSGNVYISDFYNNVIRKVNSDGLITPYAGDGTGAGIGSSSPAFGGDGGLATAAQLYVPMGVAFGRNGLVYITDRGNEVIRVVGPLLPTGIQPLTLKASGKLVVYPQPVQGGTFTVLLASTLTETAKVTVTNMLGQTVYSFDMDTNKPVSEHVSLPAGDYLLKATMQSGNCNSRMVIY